MSLHLFSNRSFPLRHCTSLSSHPPNHSSRETAWSYLASSLPLRAPLTKPWLPLKKILQQRVNFILATKTTSVGGREGKRDWSLAVPFHRLGSLWQSENISCIRNQHTRWLQGWGARTSMYQLFPQMNGTQPLTFPTGKSFSQNMSPFLAFLNTIPDLKSSDRSPTRDWVKATNHPSTLFFLRISVAQCFFPASSALRCSLSLCLSTGTEKIAKNTFKRQMES